VPALHPLARRTRLRIEDLRNVPQIWMHRSFNPALYDRLQALFLAKSLTPRVIQEVRGDIAILNLVSVGLGVGVVVSARRLGESESVVFKRVSGLSLPLDFGLAWRRGDGSRVLRNFVALLKAA
jgi:DNA-binding transcriptional LysR family regulator